MKTDPAPLIVSLCTAQVESSLTFDTDRHGVPSTLIDTLRTAGWFVVDGSWTLDRVAFVTVSLVDDAAGAYEWSAEITFY